MFLLFQSFSVKFGISLIPISPLNDVCPGEDCTSNVQQTITEAAELLLRWFAERWRCSPPRGI